MNTFLSIVCVGLVLSGCGYQLVGKETHLPPGVNSIAIPTFKNQTLEPGIEISLTQSFLREFIEDRRVKVADRNEADSFLEGVVKSFSTYSSSYDRSGQALEYQTIIVIDATLKNRNGEVLWRERDLTEKMWFQTSPSAIVSEANKAAAIQQIGKSMAERIRNRFFYNF